MDNAHVVCGRFQDNLDKVLNENEPIDYAFIDGHHDEEATISYFESFIPNLSNKAVIVFDDISWSEGMHRAWIKIIDHEKLKVAVDLRKIGVCVLNSETGTKDHIKVPLI